MEQLLRQDSKNESGRLFEYTVTLLQAQGSSSTVPPKSGGQQAGSTTSASTAASATLGTGKG